MAADAEGARKRRAGARASYLYSAAQVVVSLIYVPLLLGGIGQGEYGLYQLVGSIIAYLSIANSTLAAGANRFYSKYYVLGDEEGMANTLGILKRIYRIAYVAIAGIVAVVAVGFSVLYRGSLSPWEVEESCLILAVMAVNLILTMNNTMSVACITAHEEFIFLKLSQLGTLVLQPVLVLAFIRVWPCALTVSVIQLLCNFLCRVIQQVFARRKLGMDDRLRFLDKGLERQILVFAGGIVLGVVADQIFWKTDQLILGYLYGTAAVAVYSVGMQVVNAYAPLGFAVSSVFLPRVSQLVHVEHDMEEVSALFIRVGRLVLYPLLAVLLGFIIFGQDFIRLWAGEGYGEAYWVAVIELIPFTVDVAQNIGLTILQVMNRYGFRARMYLVAALANIVLTVVLAQRMGIVGAALASAIAMAASSGVILNWYYQRRIGLDVGAWWRNALRLSAPLIALTAAGAVAWRAFAGCNWLVLVAGIAVWAVAFSLVSYFLCANAYERSLVKGLLHRRRG
ncbi:MAG: polysaccharide biosynthesis C-terminal domain-containing protein [Coriobacteriales bacterium]|nr:polysaccharide biosynthesis C-terminal domain-containing protein [Coriobacteriales bacterium]